MAHFAGLHVSVNKTSVGIVEDTSRIMREVKARSEPDALLPVLRTPPTVSSELDWKLGHLWQRLFSALAEAELAAAPC